MVLVLGGGIMEWRRDRDRHLHIHSGFAQIPGASALDILNLASVIAKQYFPVQYKVTLA